MPCDSSNCCGLLGRGNYLPEKFKVLQPTKPQLPDGYKWSHGSGEGGSKVHITHLGNASQRTACLEATSCGLYDSEHYGSCPVCEKCLSLIPNLPKYPEGGFPLVEPIYPAAYYSKSKKSKEGDCV